MNKSIYVPIFFLLFGLVALYFGISERMENRALQQSGIVVSSLDIEGNTDVVINGSHSVREITPKFKTQKGEVLICRATIDKEMQAELSVNPIVNIRYLADNPKVCHVIGSDDSGNSTPFILGIIAILGSLVVLINRARKKVVTDSKV